MKTRFVIKLFLPVLAVFAASATIPVNAQTTNPRLSVFVSGSFFDSEQTFRVDTGSAFPDRSTEFVDGGKIGVRGTFDLNDWLAVEGTYSFGRNNLLVRELDEAPIRVRGFGVTHNQFNGNVLVFFAPVENNLRPFATGGIGVTNFSPTDDAKTAAADPLGRGFIDEPVAIDSESKFGYNFGGGVEAKLSSRLGFRFDFRDYITDIPRFGVPQVEPSGGGDFYPVDDTIQNLVFSVGVVFYLH